MYDTNAVIPPRFALGARVRDRMTGATVEVIGAPLPWGGGFGNRPTRYDVLPLEARDGMRSFYRDEHELEELPVIVETVVYDGSEKVWRVLNVSTGTARSPRWRASRPRRRSTSPHRRGRAPEPSSTSGPSTGLYGAFLPNKPATGPDSSTYETARKTLRSRGKGFSVQGSGTTPDVHR
jgi:hypothetical protein